MFLFSYKTSFCLLEQKHAIMVRNGATGSALAEYQQKRG
jgi:hypothetical protein